MIRLYLLKLSIVLFAWIFYIPALLSSFFLSGKNSARWWRQMSVLFINTGFFLNGIRIRGENISGPYRSNLIYASNHPSPMDGFLLQSFLGPDAVPIVAPLAQFPYIIAKWLVRMDAIDVIRDDVDQARYPESNTKEKALFRALQALMSGESIIIFPEGHTEMIEALYYFHTGTARLSLASGVPIQPVIIKDAHNVFSNNFGKKNKVVSVAFHERIVPDRAHGQEILFPKPGMLLKEAEEMTEKLENEILRGLPLRLKRDQRAPATGVGVFVDIDMTIYHGLSQIDFVVYLMKRGLVKKSEGFYLFGIFFLEKIGVMEHEKVMQKGMKIVGGWESEAIERLIGRFFRQVAMPKIEYGLFSILEDHLAKKHHLVFVTEAMHPLAQSFVDFFAAEKAIDTSLKIRGRTYTGEIELLCRGGTKAREVARFAKENNLDLRRSYAYSDSESDLPLLSLVGHPVAVRPDRKLRRAARERGMLILDFAS